TNVIAKLEGSDAKLKDEYLIYTAHWDHMGRDTKLQGDQIFNGAHDNASGTAGLLELAKAFAKLSPAPQRSILFLAVTGGRDGAPRREVLRRESALPARTDAGKHQYGRAQPMGTHQRRGDCRLRQFDARRYAHRSGDGPGARGQSRRRA